MEYIKSVWGVVQGDPKFMRRINGWLTIFWVVMIPTSLVTGWVRSVTFVLALSLWALVSGHWSAWQAARVEVEQQREDARDDDGRLVKRIIKETNVVKSKRGTMKTTKTTKKQRS